MQARFVTICAGMLLLLSGCATPPVPMPAPVLEEVPQRPLLVVVPQACPICLDQTDEIVRLRQALASREAELRDLRAAQREQTREVAKSTSETARVQARQRRLATQADAASAIAEAEVAQEAVRERGPVSPSPALSGLAQMAVDAAATAYARSDFATAYERGVQAQVLLAAMPASDATRPAGGVEVPLGAGVPVRATAPSPLRRQPGRGSVVVTVASESPLVALAWRAGYVRVSTATGARGWISEDRIALR